MTAQASEPRAWLSAGAAGFLFAIGLGVAGMLQPSKIAAFLDVTGAWDPSLAFVMVGAIGVHFMALRRMPASPRTASGTIDARLLGGAALFGLGWGAAGFCPGPAVVSVATCAPGVLGFVAAMLLGMALVRLLFERGPGSQPDERAVPLELSGPGADLET